MAQVSGPGATGRRRSLLTGLLARATEAEQRLLGGLVSGELRHGAQVGLVTDAVAVAADVPLTAVRMALLLSGSLPVVAEAALRGGLDALAAFRLEVGRPLSPMLAGPGADLADALARTPRAVVDWKLDGIRVQVHRNGDDVQGQAVHTFDLVVLAVEWGHGAGAPGGCRTCTWARVTRRPAAS